MNELRSSRTRCWSIFRSYAFCLVTSFVVQPLWEDGTIANTIETPLIWPTLNTLSVTSQFNFDPVSGTTPRQTLTVTLGSALTFDPTQIDAVIESMTTSDDDTTINLGTPTYDSASRTLTFIVPSSETNPAVKTAAGTAVSGVLPDGNYQLRIFPTLQGTNGQALTQPYSYDFFYLAGDVNHDRIVNFIDMAVVGQNYNQSGKRFSQGDANYDGSVNVTDTNLIYSKYQSQMPAPGPFNVWTFSNTQINVSWEDNVIGETGYRVQWSDDGHSFLPGNYVNLDPDTTYWDDTTLTDGQRRWYRVRAYGGVDTAYSLKKAATTTSRMVPVTAHVTGDNKQALYFGSASGIDLTAVGYTPAGREWNKPETYVFSMPSDGYIYGLAWDYGGYVAMWLGDFTLPDGFMVSNQTDWKCYIGGPTHPTGQPTSLTPPALSSISSWITTANTTYGWATPQTALPNTAPGPWGQITGIDPSAKFLWPTGISATLDNYVIFRAPLTSAQPALPFAGVKASYVPAGSRVDLDWSNDPTSGVTYSVYRSLDSNFDPDQTVLMRSNLTSSFFSDATVDVATVYYYSVTANPPTDDPSEIGFASTITQINEQPDNLKTSVVDESDIDVSWDDESGNEAGYQVYRMGEDDQDWILLAELPPDTTYFSDSGLEQDTDYQYKVQAIYADAPGEAPTTAPVEIDSGIVYRGFIPIFLGKFARRNTGEGMDKLAKQIRDFELPTVGGILKYRVRVYQTDPRPDIKVDGSGQADIDLENAIDAGIVDIGMIGHSWGGGAVYTLANKIQNLSQNNGRAKLDYTAYVDAIKLGAPGIPETRRPANTRWHTNLYQKTPNPFDAFLAGDSMGASADLDHRVTGSENGGFISHTTIDDSLFVRLWIFSDLLVHMPLNELQA